MSRDGGGDGGGKPTAPELTKVAVQAGARVEPDPHDPDMLLVIGPTGAAHPIPKGPITRHSEEYLEHIRRACRLEAEKNAARKPKTPAK